MDSFQKYGIFRKRYAVFCVCVHKCSASYALIKDNKAKSEVTQKHLWQAISIGAFCYLPGGNVSPSCHPERRKAHTPPAVEPVGRCVASGSTRERMLFSPEILLGWHLALLRSSTSLTLRSGWHGRNYALQENMSLINSVVLRYNAQNRQAQW